MSETSATEQAAEYRTALRCRATGVKQRPDEARSKYPLWCPEHVRCKCRHAMIERKPPSELETPAAHDTDDDEHHVQRGDEAPNTALVNARNENVPAAIPRLMIRPINRPEITKKMSTPTKPPRKPGSQREKPITVMTASALSRIYVAAMFRSGDGRRFWAIPGRARGYTRSATPGRRFFFGKGASVQQVTAPNL